VITEQSSANLTLVTSTGESVTVPQSQVVTLRESSVSLMPEGLLKTLKPQELRDLFSYLQSPAPISK
jgi:putative heme-binding domain-containing protein